jgi:hypothetical protein
MAPMRRLPPLLVGVAIALTACGGGSSDRPTPSGSPLASGALGVVTPDAAERTVTALCDLRAIRDPDAANATFFDDAHQELHVIAGATTDVDRGAAGALLVTMQRVEADLEATSLPANFGADVEALRAATVRALRAVGLGVPGCP